MTEPPDNFAATPGKPEYVYYKLNDYAEFGSRTVAQVVDIVVIVLLLFGLVMTCELLRILPKPGENTPVWLTVSLAAIPYLYLTVLKRTRSGTPGYWIADIRIVNLKGKPPSILAMTLRLLWFLTVGPMTWLGHVHFLSNDGCRQAIRDKLFGTYVVRRDAHPAGLGWKTYGPVDFRGLILKYPMVIPEVEDP